MPRFKVLGSSHKEGRGEGATKHRAGAIVESDKDLDKLFPNKFKRVAEKNRRPVDRDDRLNQSGGKQGDPPADVRTPAGSRAGRPAAQPAGSRPSPKKANPVDLDFPDDSPDPKPKNAVVPGREDEDRDEDDEEADDEDQEIEEEDDEVDFGEEVSGDFAGAADADLKVFKKGRKYTVVDADKPGVPLHDDELTNKPAVQKFIKDRAGDTEE